MRHRMFFMRGKYARLGPGMDEMAWDSMDGRWMECLDGGFYAGFAEHGLGREKRDSGVPAGYLAWRLFVFDR